MRCSKCDAHEKLHRCGEVYFECGSVKSKPPKEDIHTDQCRINVLEGQVQQLIHVAQITKATLRVLTSTDKDEVREVMKEVKSYVEQHPEIPMLAGLGEVINGTD